MSDFDILNPPGCATRFCSATAVYPATGLCSWHENERLRAALATETAKREAAEGAMQEMTDRACKLRVSLGGAELGREMAERRAEQAECQLAEARAAYRDAMKRMSEALDGVPADIGHVLGAIDERSRQLAEAQDNGRELNAIAMQIQADKNEAIVRAEAAEHELACVDIARQMLGAKDDESMIDAVLRYARELEPSADKKGQK